MPNKLVIIQLKIHYNYFYFRQAGRHPIPMMDRQQPDQQPSSQVGFLTGICLPCYNLLNNLIPECKPLLDMCQNNLEHWQQIDIDIKEKKQQNQFQSILFLSLLRFPVVKSTHFKKKCIPYRRYKNITKTSYRLLAFNFHKLKF